MKKSLYELLEVAPDATQEQIKAAMMRLGKVYATKSQTNEVARTYFNQIKEAYKILSSPYRRASYDHTLKLSQEQQTNRIIPVVGRQVKKWAIWFWQIFKKIIATTWRVTRHTLLHSLKTGKQQTLKGLKLTEQHAIKSLKLTEEQALKGLKLTEEQALKGLKLTEEHAVKSWDFIKKQASTTYIGHILMPGEKIMYQARTHWFFYLDLGAVLLVAITSYLLIDVPDFIKKESMPTVVLWAPKIFFNKGLEISVWRLGLMSLLFVGIMMLWEAFIIKQTTELAVTSKRVIAKFGFLNRTIIEIKLRRFESITIEQGIFGTLFDYGSITITGMGGVKTTVPNISYPLKFKKILWQVLEYVGYKEEGDN